MGPAPSSLASTIDTFQPGMQATIQPPNQPPIQARIERTIQPVCLTPVQTANQPAVVTSGGRSAPQHINPVPGPSIIQLSPISPVTPRTPQPLQIKPVVTTNVSVISGAIVPTSRVGAPNVGHVTDQEVIAKVLTALAQTSALTAQGQGAQSPTKQPELVQTLTPTKQLGLVQTPTPKNKQGMVHTSTPTKQQDLVQTHAPAKQSLVQSPVLPHSPTKPENLSTNSLQSSTKPQGLVQNTVLSQVADDRQDEQRPSLPHSPAKSSSAVENPFAIQHLKRTLNPSVTQSFSKSQENDGQNNKTLQSPGQNQSSAKAQALDNPRPSKGSEQTSGEKSRIDSVVAPVTKPITGESTSNGVPFITNVTPVARAESETLEPETITTMQASKTGIQASQAGIQAPRTGIQAPYILIKAPQTRVQVPQPGIQAPQLETQVPQTEIQVSQNKSSTESHSSANTVEKHDDELEPGEVRDEDSNGAMDLQVGLSSTSTMYFVTYLYI